jgi:hypothetical protein
MFTTIRDLRVVMKAVRAGRRSAEEVREYVAVDGCA